MIDTLWRDITYAARSLARTPVFTVAAVITLALGIGANATIFTLLDAVLFKPLPVANASELITLYEHAPLAEPGSAPPDAAGGTGRYLRFSYPRFLLLERALGSHGSMAAMTRSARFIARLPGQTQASPIFAQLVSGGYFSTLGVRMQRGRPLTDEDLRGSQPAAVAVVSDGYSKRMLGGTDRALGQTIVINGLALTVVGITPPGFVGVWTDMTADAWIPLTHQQTLKYRGNWSSYGGVDSLAPWQDEERIAWLNIAARVAPEDLAQARAILASANAQGLRLMTDTFIDARERPSMLAHTLVVEPFASGFSGLRERFSDALYVLAAMVAVVLLVTCANIANLLLARATGRSREVGIRLSLGASSGRLIRQHLTESLVLAFAGGAAGVLAGQWASGLLAHAILNRSDELPPVFSFDSRVVIFGAGLSIASAIAFGLVPAFRAIRVGFTSRIGSNQRVAVRSAMKGMRPLVTAQLALSFAVVLGAALLGRTLTYFARIDPGFDVDHLVSATIDPDGSGYTRDQMPALGQRLVAAVQAVAGVTSSSVSTCGLIANCSYRSGFEIEGAGGGIQIRNNWVGPGYFSTVGIPMVTGRDFTARDTAQSQRVAIISESIARRYFPGQSAIGKRLGYRGSLDTEIVAVVRDARSITLHDEPISMVYFPIGQPPTFAASPRSLDVRVDGNGALAVAAIRDAIQRSEPGLLIDGVNPMSTRLQRDLARERLIAYLATGFGVLALLLACVGLYGVLSYTVARRTQEIGVRMALGARPGDLTRMVIGDGTRVILAGVTIGLAAAVGVGRLVSTLLTGVSASEPSTYVVVGLALTGVSLAACYLPARRAARVNPIAALRTE
jgi:predicted permease